MTLEKLLLHFIKTRLLSVRKWRTSHLPGTKISHSIFFYWVSAQYVEPEPVTFFRKTSVSQRAIARTNAGSYAIMSYILEKTLPPHILRRLVMMYADEPFETPFSCVVPCSINHQGWKLYHLNYRTKYAFFYSK